MNQPPVSADSNYSDQTGAWVSWCILLSLVASVVTHLMWPQVFVLILAANVTVLFVGAFVVNMLYHFIRGAEEFPLHCGAIVLAPVIGGPLVFWFGWTSTAIVLGVFAGWASIGALSERVERRRSSAKRLGGEFRISVSRRSTQILKLHEDVIGYVVIDTFDTFDMFHVLGRFTPGPEYVKHESLFDRLVVPEDGEDETEDDDYESEAYLSWENAFNEVNECALVLEDSNSGEVKAIRDLKLTSSGRVEFKFELESR